MAIKKSDLYSSIWASCDELRGGMDASQYKDYVLFMLFIKYVSDKYADYDGFEPPIVIPKGASFRDMVALKGDANIGEKINTDVIQALVEANASSNKFARTDFPDFNDPNKLGDGKARVERISNLIAIFESPALDFAQNRAEHDDILGDAYEYLMRHFATQSGKSKGQFYTPSEVSRVIAKVIGISKHNTVAATTAYDPTCGSGSLLLKVAAEAGRNITLEGQEKDSATAGLARMNMILHDFPDAHIASGGEGTLVMPRFRDHKDERQLRSYDYVVANPPFSDKAWSTGMTLGESGEGDPFKRFSWGVPPKKQGDYAYLLHIVRSMKSTGKAACILPHGVLFRGNAEAAIRRNLVRSGILKGIIGLPANLFYGTGIPACILVLDKENAAARKGVFMIDASKAYRKDGPKNRLRDQDIHRIVDTFRKQDESDPRYARMVPFDEIADARNDYNLNLPRYIDSSEPEDLHDIDAHLRGGIPDRDLDALADYWQVMPTLRAQLFSPVPRNEGARASAGRTDGSPLPPGEGLGVRGRSRPAPVQATHATPSAIHEPSSPAYAAPPSRPGYSYPGLPITEVKSHILAHPEFIAFQDTVRERFVQWRSTHAPQMAGFDRDHHPKELIETLSEALLDAFRGAPLVDAYDIYQHLMDYVAETLQDDLYLIAAVGWQAGARPRELRQIKNKDGKLSWPEKEDYRLGKRRFKSDLIPAPLMIDRYFSAERDAIAALEAELACVEQQLEAQRDEHGGEDGLLAEANEAGEGEPVKLSAKSVKAALSRLAGDPDEAEARRALKHYAALLEQQAKRKGEIKSASEALDAALHAKYAALGEAEVKSLVIDDKWLAVLATAVQGELDRVSQTLTGRIRQLAERYAKPLPQLEEEVEVLAARVAGHLERMGGARC